MTSHPSKDNDPPEDWAPTPDPTKLTTDAVKLAVDQLRELYDFRFDAQEKAVGAALASTEKAIDKAEIIVRATIDKVELSAEKRYLSIEKEFHEHLEQARQEAASALKASNEQIKSALEASNLAINKSEIATEKRFESVNEFRGQLSDQTKTFISRGEAESAIARNSEKIQDLADRINRTEGRGVGLNAGWVYLLASLGAIGTLISIYLAIQP